ncbi:nucleolar Complex 2 protein [Zygosaccharomyces mellis]|uniref:Nucleolar Complex 2 protein n=1 Tax=Zygosaccharomyces mellis TaxID=42258 RepID=A0A4C2E9F8_9SACH|nr:nucleolar Complex 2 protein [Zygosaccharomyces mellis]
MGKVSKATKKFQSRHLKHTLDQRKREKEYKKKLQTRRGNKSEKEKNDAALTKDEQKAKKSAKEEVFNDMPIDEFFEDGIKIPKQSKKNKNKSMEGKDESDNDESSSSDDENDVAESMAQLSEKDPEFYKYLQENDKNLLDFSGSNPLDDIEDDEEEKETPEKDGAPSEEGDSDEEEAKTVTKTELTLKLVKEWRDQLHNSPNFKTVRNVVSAFKMAINMNNEEAKEEYKYVMSDERAFKELLFVALRDLPRAIQTMIPYQNKQGCRTLPTGTNVSKMSSIVKSHSSSLVICLNDIFNTETAALVLQSVNQLLPYLISYRRILKEAFKAVVEIWSTTREVETQIATFAFLISASKEYKKALLEIVLKTTYSTFIKNCRRTDMRTMPLINFQKNSASELFGIDETLGYQVGFEYIRQLAIHLRNTITATTKKTNKHNPAEAYKIVYNWQFCHSLDLWSRVLSFACNFNREKGHESQMRDLIYPLVQVTLGVIRLIPTPQFFPLRFYLIRSLIRLSQNTGVYIPIFSLLLEILNSNAFTKVSKKKESLEAFDFDHNIKCNKQYLGTRTYQEGLTEQFIDLLGEYFVLYCKSVSFPELATPAIIALRRFMKTSKNPKYNKQLSNVVEKLNQNSSYIEQKRSKVEFSPSNKVEVARFLSDVPWEKTPLGAYVVVQREVKEEKAKILRESLEEEQEDEKNKDEDGNKEPELDGDGDSEMSDE